MKDMLEDIAEAFHTNPEFCVTNKRTGQRLQGETVTPEDIFNFDSHGELAFIFEWHMNLFPDKWVGSALWKEMGIES